MKGRRAIVIPTSITIALLLFGLITAQLTRVVTSQGNTSHLDERNRAFYLAVAGVNYGMSLLKEDPANEIYDVDNPFVVDEPDGSRFEFYYESAGPNGVAVRASGFTQKGVSAQAGRLLERNVSQGVVAALWPGGGAGIDSVFIKTADSSGPASWRLLRPVRDDPNSPIIPLTSLLTTADSVYGYAPIGAGGGPELWWYHLTEHDWEFIDLPVPADRLVTSGEHLLVFGTDQSLTRYALNQDDGTPHLIGSPGLPPTPSNLTATSVAMDPNENIYLSYIDPGPPLRERIALFDYETGDWQHHSSPDLFNIRELSVGIGPEGDVVTYALAELEDGTQAGLWSDIDNDDDGLWDYLGRDDVDQLTSDPEGRVFTLDQQPNSDDEFTGSNINPNLGTDLEVPDIPARFWRFNSSGRLVRDSLDGNVPNVGSLVGGSSASAPAFSSVADF